MKTLDLSIIIVNYMTYDKTVNTIESVLKFVQDINYQIILVDNASPNDDALKLEKYVIDIENLLYIKNLENLGFAKGNNIALKVAKGKYVAFLNSDTELTTDAFSYAFKYMEKNTDVGALGTRLIDVYGKLDHGCKRGFPTPIDSFYYLLKFDKLFKNPYKYGKYRMDYLSEYEINEVDVISGAFFLTRKSILDKIGSFDEIFFMYGEDIDLCYRIKKNGYKIIYNPELGDVIHYKGASAKKRRIKTIYNFYEAMLIFYDKNYKDEYNFMVRALIYIGVYGIMSVKLVKNLFRK